jgi:tetratricopeptide (TPR) repeat protein
MAVVQFHGAAPGPHHLTNLLLHAVNACLLFLVLKRMTGAIWRSAFVAAVFAWHPLHVESVAWVSERKDVLSTLFWLLTMWAYARYSEQENRKARGGLALAKTQSQKPNLAAQNSRASFSRLPSSVFYLLAVFLFALGLMSKPMLVTLPFVLLLLDYWPLQRTASLSSRVLEKLPFLTLSLAACVLAFWAQNKSEAVGIQPLLLRLENSAVSYASYFGTFFWPVNLAAFYPYPDSIPFWRAGLAALALGAISCAVIYGMGRRAYLVVGWLWFLGTLVPVIGLVQVGMQARADRYTYIPYIGLAVMASWGLADLCAAWPRIRTALAWFAAPLALAGCLVATRSQVTCWQDSAALYEHALKVTSGNYIAHNNIGDLLMEKGKLDEATAQFREVIRLKPSVAKPYNNLGKAYALQEKLDDAMAMFSKAIALNPGLAESHYNLGNAYFVKGNMPPAITELKTALRLKPDDVTAQKRLAEAWLKTGKGAEAVPYCEAVLRAQPEDAQAQFALGWALLLDHRLELALPHYQAAVRLAPNAPQYLNGLAWLYATSPRAEIRNGAEAVRLAERACQLTKRQDSRTLDTLAAAYAEAGRFPEALNATEEIHSLALASHDPATAETARQRSELYQAGKPYRDEP